MSISTTIKTIQDIMRKDAGVDGDAQRISQLVWMIFLKIFDDREAEYELLDDHYHSPIPEALRWRNWATDSEGMTGETLLDFVDNVLFKTLKDANTYQDKNPRGFVIRAVFEDAYNYMKNGTLIRQVINKLNEIDFQIFADLFSPYLKFALMSSIVQDFIRNKATGMTAEGIKAAKLKLILVPLPALNEQKRIVTKVDKLMKLCDELETKLTQTQTESEKIINAAVKQLLTV